MYFVLTLESTQKCSPCMKRFSAHDLPTNFAIAYAWLSSCFVRSLRIAQTALEINKRMPSPILRAELTLRKLLIFKGLSLFLSLSLLLFALCLSVSVSPSLPCIYSSIFILFLVHLRMFCTNTVKNTVLTHCNFPQMSTTIACTKLRRSVNL